MSTGYTAAIKEGISFQEYALNCARAFGALVLMRDDPADAPIPDTFEPSDYHFKALAESQKELSEINACSDEELEVRAEAKYRTDFEYYEKSKNERDELRGKYDAMLEMAKAYEPPTPEHTGYADFLVSQIVESIKWDCNPSIPVKLTGAAYKEERLSKIKWSLDFHIKERDAEIKSAADRTTWVRELKKSLQITINQPTQ
jgi:hypothetical protein